MANSGFTRRRVMATAAAAASASVALPFMRGAHAAGRLSVGFWDHWVPGANDTARKLAEQWAEKEKVGARLHYLDRRQAAHHHRGGGAGRLGARRLGDVDLAAQLLCRQA